MTSDWDIKRDVEDELRLDPDIDGTDIAVTAKDGVVTLTGFTRSFRQKRKAERRPDPEIARDAVEEIKSELPLSWEKIRITVEDGWVTLEGEVAWHYQRERAEQAIWRVRGIKGVDNHIEVRPQVPPVEIKRKIEEALRRAEEIDASRIKVEANGSEVILRGRVRSWVEREEAERAAWRAPGVTKVENRIRIGA
jgi:osmotically-inducible protein OsmY